MQFKDIIFSIRKSRNFTQKEFSKLLNVSDKTISKWETGVSVPDLETIMAISRTLDIPIIDRLSESQDDNRSETSRNNDSTLIRKFKDLQLIILSLTILLIFASYLIRIFLYRLGIYFLPFVLLLFVVGIVLSVVNHSIFYSQYEHLSFRKKYDEVYLKSAFLLIDGVTILVMYFEVFVFYVPNLLNILIVAFIQIVPYLLKSNMMKRHKFIFMQDIWTKIIKWSFGILIIIDFILQLMFQIPIDLHIPLFLLTYVMRFIVLAPVALSIIFTQRKAYISEM